MKQYMLVLTMFVVLLFGGCVTGINQPRTDAVSNLRTEASTGPNRLADDNPAQVWRFAVFPDMQGRDDDDYSFELRYTQPDGSEITNEALTKKGDYYIGIDINQDGIWDGSSHQIDVSDPFNPKFVLDDKGYGIPVDSTKRQDAVGDWKVLPLPYAEPIIDKLIEENVDLVLFIGDFTEHRSEHEYVLWREHIAKPLIEAGIDIYPIRGNHEIVNGRNWLAWFADAYETQKTSVNNVDNDIDVYSSEDGYDQGYQLYRHYAGSLLDEKIASGAIQSYSEDYKDLVYYFIHRNTLFVALDPYFADLVSTQYRGTWSLLYDWLEDVFEREAPRVDHIVVFSHEAFVTKHRPQMYEEKAYGSYLQTLAEEKLRAFDAGSQDSERPAQFDLLAYDMGQLGFVLQQNESRQGLVEQLFGLLARYQVHFLVGHDHQYMRSLIHSRPGDKTSPAFTQIITGNASWKAYENNFGANPEFESPIYQDNFVDPQTGHSGKISFVLAEVNGRQTTYTNHYATVSFKDEYASENKLRYDFDRKQWNFYVQEDGQTVNRPIPLEWKTGDMESYTSDSLRRIVGPGENYYTTTTAAIDQGYLGTEFTIIDGTNLTYNSSKAHLRNNTIQNMSELLALSWFTDDNPTTLSDIILINGNQNQDGSYIDHEGVIQTTTVTDSSLGATNKYGSQNAPYTIIEGERIVSTSPSLIFNNRSGFQANNPTMVTRDGILVKGRDYAREHAKDYGPLDNLYTGDGIIGENGLDFADAMAVMMSVPADVPLDEVTLGRYDEASKTWAPVFRDECFVKTGYSDHYSVLYRLDEQEPEGGFGTDGYEQQYWGYNHNAHAIWGFIHTDGMFAIIRKP
ncbi:MAG: metallophosphatase family protein [Chloroflexales bacterium]|nr:metallophosphatase family protein [Chloroflexales bacterium]